MVEPIQAVYKREIKKRRLDKARAIFQKQYAHPTWTREYLSYSVRRAFPYLFDNIIIKKNQNSLSLNLLQKNEDMAL